LVILSVLNLHQPDFYLNNDQPAQPSGGRIAHLLNFKSTGFLFEHTSTGVTVWQTDRPPDAAALRLNCYKKLLIGNPAFFYHLV
jgi:hypothetical protein